MSTTAWLFFLPACFAVNLAPGPNNLLSINVAARHGFMTAFLGGTGRLVAFAAMIALAATGLAVVLHASEWFFLAIKLAGAAYLIWLAIQLWRSDTPAIDVTHEQSASLARIVRQEFLVAAGNPKAILVFTAFLPQFVDIARQCCRNSPPSAQAFSCSSAWRSRCTRGRACTSASGWCERA